MATELDSGVLWQFGMGHERKALQTLFSMKRDKIQSRWDSRLSTLLEFGSHQFPRRNWRFISNPTVWNS